MPTVPGYDVQELLGSGAGCDVHRAVCATTGEQVAVKVPRTPAAAAALRREAAALRAVDSPYVVGVVDVLDEALVLRLAGGGSLAELLARRGALLPGEVVTVVGPLAQALAAVHAAGLVHGDVCPANLLLTDDGMPLLADLSSSRLVGSEDPVDATPPWVDPAVLAGAAPTPASDVWSLAAVCHALLAGSPPDPEVGAPLSLLAPRTPRPLLDAVAAALSPDPDARPTAAALAAAVHAACPALPVRALPPEEQRTRRVRGAAPVPGAQPAPRAPHWHRLRSRRAAVLAGSLAALLVAAAAGAASTRWGSGADGTALPSVAAEPAADWRAVLADLDRRRAVALEHADPAVLAEVWAAGSDGLAGDRAAVARLAAARQVAVGVRHRVVDVDVVRVSATTALLRVVDVLADHEVRDARGRVVQRVAGRAAASYDVGLVRVDGSWRLAEVVPA